MQVRSNIDFGGVARVTDMLDPVSAQDGATKAYVDSAVEGLAWKDSVRVATQSNVNLSSPGATIDGVTMVAGDRVLVRAQSSAADNGIYIWNGASSAMTRAPDMSVAAEFEQAITAVEEGTSAGVSYRQTAVNVTVGSTSIAWTTFGVVAPAASDTQPGIVEIATQSEVDAGSDTVRAVTPATLASWSGRIRKHSANLGDGSATQYDVTHNFNSRDVQVEVYRNSSSYDTVLCDIGRPDANTVRLNFATAPSSNQFRVVILG